ncbi:MAG: sugar phosphate nucleotidyltransferase [Bacteroidota bacterium]|nr:sugar phosphate nucleotidyltransferase [Candidatus Kapabacteria bacterium]MDW8219906.1 sugar phosphate nucleotidyltransferase [Bacteroidota bacterium]
MKTIALILAGGSGVRLWPLSREHFPKQFLPLFENKSLLQHTFERLRLSFAPTDIIVVTGDSLSSLTAQQLPELPQDNIITEPFGRNTAAAIGLALIQLQHRISEEFVVAVFPSDHVITNARDFIATVSLAADTAAVTDGIIALGVQPTRPDTGLGYIQAFHNTPHDHDTFVYPMQTMHKVLTFAEKPDIETAIRFLNSGDFLWNTGIFCAKATILWKQYEELLPDHAHLLRLLQKHLDRDTYAHTLRTIYRQFRSISIDFGIMEKTRQSYVIEGEFDWSDIGSWDAMYQLAAKDTSDNAFEGEIVAVNVTNSFVRASKKVIALLDVDDLIVVEADDVLLICRNGHGQNIKELVDFLRRKNMKELL